MHNVCRFVSKANIEMCDIMLNLNVQDQPNTRSGRFGTLYSEHLRIVNYKSTAKNADRRLYRHCDHHITVVETHAWCLSQHVSTYAWQI